MLSIPSASAMPEPATSGNGQTYLGLFAIMRALFCLWGFMTWFNELVKLIEARAAGAFTEGT